MFGQKILLNRIWFQFNFRLLNSNLAVIRIDLKTKEDIGKNNPQNGKISPFLVKTKHVLLESGNIPILHNFGVLNQKMAVTKINF